MRGGKNGIDSTAQTTMGAFQRTFWLDPSLPNAHTLTSSTEIINLQQLSSAVFSSFRRLSTFTFRAEEIVKFRRVVGSDWLEYIYNV